MGSVGSGGNGLVPSLAVVRAGNSDPEWKAGGGGRGLGGRRIPSGVSNTEQKDVISTLNPVSILKEDMKALKGICAPNPRVSSKQQDLGSRPPSGAMFFASPCRAAFLRKLRWYHSTL